MDTSTRNTFAHFKTNFMRYKPLISELIGRDLKLKYRRSALGYLWSLLNPLLMMVVMSLVFSHVFRFDVENYPLYLICGNTLFSCFSEATNQSMVAIITNGSLIRKVYIPKYILPIARVTSSFVSMSFSLVAILIVMIFTRTPLHLSMLLIFVPILFLYLFACGVGMLLSALAVPFRDTMHLYSVALMVWMYVTPIFYPLEAVSERIAFFITKNPLYIYINFFRQLVLYGRVPPVTDWVSGFATALIVFALGAGVFTRMQRDFILYV